MTGDGIFTVVIEAVNLGTMTAEDHVGFYLDEEVTVDSQPLFGITTDGGSGLTASFAVGPGSSLSEGSNGLVARGPITLPATVVLTRTGATVVATIDGVTFGTAVLDDAGVLLFPTVFDEGPGNGSISFSSIVVTGASIPDVNDPPAPPAPSLAISRNGAVDSAFIDGSASWSVTFSEEVTFVTDDDFSLTLTGDANADAPTVALAKLTGTAFTVTAANVTGIEGTLRLNFNGGTDVETVADSTAVEGMQGGAGSMFSIGIALPALGLLGLGLAASAMAVLGASAARSKKNRPSDSTLV